MCKLKSGSPCPHTCQLKTPLCLQNGMQSLLQLYDALKQGEPFFSWINLQSPQRGSSSAHMSNLALSVRNSLIAYRKFGAPAVSRWRWVGSCVHAPSSARTRLGRAYITPLLKATQTVKWQPYRRTVAARRLTIGYRHVMQPSQRAVSAKWRGHTSHMHSPLIKRSINKATLAIVQFWLGHGGF